MTAIKFRRAGDVNALQRAKELRESDGRKTWREVPETRQRAASAAARW
jgi:hypothetical protein